MVKKGLFILLLLSFLISKSQRLNIGIDVGSFALSNTKTIFEEEPFYYLYAAPFSEIQEESNYDNYIEYGQVRLVRIWGISPNLDLKVRFGGNINYKSKNNFAIKLGFSMFNTSDNVYYSFQPLMIDMGNDSEANSYYHTKSFDNTIVVSRYINTYSLILSYKFLKKYKIKPFILVGFTERIQLYSHFSSKTLEHYFSYNEMSDNYIYNIQKLEENLYEQVKYDGFSHYVNLGLGFILHSFSVSASWNTTVGNINSEYYIRQSFVSVNLSYDLISIPLFK